VGACETDTGGRATPIPVVHAREGLGGPAARQPTTGTWQPPPSRPVNSVLRRRHGATVAETD